MNLVIFQSILNNMELRLDSRLFSQDEPVSVTDVGWRSRGELLVEDMILLTHGGALEALVVPEDTNHLTVGDCGDLVAVRVG